LNRCVEHYVSWQVTQLADLCRKLQNPDCAMAQAIRQRFLSVEAWVQSQASPCRICGG